MKQAFIKVAKTIVIVACIAIAVVFGILVLNDKTNYKIPIFILSLFLLLVFVAAICAVIAFVMAMLEDIKRDPVSGVGGFLLLVAILMGAKIAIDYFAGGKLDSIFTYLVDGVMFVAAVKAGTYLFTKREEEEEGEL